MKIIDLLNKISRGEEVPHVQYDNVEAYIGADGYLKDNYGDNVEWWIDKKWLNTEVEIIEEDEKIEKLPMIDGTANILLAINQTRRKINEIIDYINKGE